MNASFSSVVWIWLIPVSNVIPYPLAYCYWSNSVLLFQVSIEQLDYLVKVSDCGLLCWSWLRLLGDWVMLTLWRNYRSQRMTDDFEAESRRANTDVMNSTQTPFSCPLPRSLFSSGTVLITFNAQIDMRSVSPYILYIIYKGWKTDS